MTDYKKYPVGTRVKIKSTGATGDVFESLLGYVSVFIDNKDTCTFLSIDEIEFENLTEK
jgi:hypothetical protein